MSLPIAPAVTSPLPFAQELLVSQLSIRQRSLWRLRYAALPERGPPGSGSGDGPWDVPQSLGHLESGGGSWLGTESDGGGGSDSEGEESSA